MAIRESEELKQMVELSEHEQLVTTLVIGNPAVKYVRTAQRDTARVTYK